MSKRTILCIDDEKMVLDSLKRELKASIGDKYLIEVAESGEEALEIIDELIEEGQECPLVISDYIMPEMKGDEVLEKVRNIKPEIYSIMLTGQATIEGVTNAINRAGLYRYIAKPWETNDFLMTINEALKSYDREKQISEQNDSIRKQNEEIKQKNVEITKQNQEIKEKNIEISLINENLDQLVKIRTRELEETIQELLKVRIGKKAYSILIIVALAMFLAVDVFIEPILENMLHDFYIVLAIKGVIALLIKPLESLIEKILFSRTRQKIIKIRGK